MLPSGSRMTQRNAGHSSWHCSHSHRTWSVYSWCADRTELFCQMLCTGNHSGPSPHAAKLWNWLVGTQGYQDSCQVAVSFCLKDREPLSISEVTGVGVFLNSDHSAQLFFFLNHTYKRQINTYFLCMKVRASILKIGFWMLQNSNS